MKTLNEQIYEYLLTSGKAITIPEVTSEEKFKNVPPMMIGKSLLSICKEKIANYYIEDGKIYFTTDLSVGYGPIGSQNNMNNIIGALSSLLSGSNDEYGFISNYIKAFPEVGNSDMDDAINAITFTAAEKINDFEMAFPVNYADKAEDNYELVRSYSDSIISSIKINKTTLDEDISEKIAKMAAEYGCIQVLNKVFRCLSYPEKYSGRNAAAFYLPAVPNSVVFIVTPEGCRGIDVQWNFLNDYPSKKTVCKFFDRWLDTYRYWGEKQFVKFLPLDRQENIKSELSEAFEEKLSDEYSELLDDIFHLINIAKNSADSEDSVIDPTRCCYLIRKLLDKVAEEADDLIVQATNVITHYNKTSSNIQYMSRIYQLSQKLIVIASEISVTVKSEVSNIPYFSATDISFGDSSTENYTVQVFPAHYLDFLELINAQLSSMYSNDSNMLKDVKLFYKEMKARYDAENKPLVYYPDFTFEGKMIVAYLGHAEEVVVPDFVTGIGAYAFANAKELKSITLGENVSSIGFCPFEGCSSLKTIKILGNIENIQGPLAGFSGNYQITVQGYKNSSVEKLCKKDRIRFEPIEETNLDCIINLEESKYDIYQGFAFPKITGFKTTLELAASEKRKLASDEATSHIQYGMVPLDKEFSEYKYVKYSITIVNNPIDVPQGGIQIAEEIEQRLAQPTVHAVYRTVEADKRKVLVRYDIIKEGSDEGVSWSHYIVVIAREKKIVIAQMFFNGNYTHRQQEYAIEKWASQVITESTYNSNNKKLLEAKRKAEEEQKKKEQRQKDEAKKQEIAKLVAEWEEWLKQSIENIDAQYEPSIEAAKANKKSEMNRIKAEIAALKNSITAEIENYNHLGFFAFGDKKASKERLDSLKHQYDAKEAEKENTKRRLDSVINGWKVAKQDAIDSFYNSEDGIKAQIIKTLNSTKREMLLTEILSYNAPLKDLYDTGYSGRNQINNQLDELVRREILLTSNASYSINDPQQAEKRKQIIKEIIMSVVFEPMTAGDIARSDYTLKEVPQNMFSQCLNELVRDGMLKRDVIGGRSYFSYK